LYPDVFEALDRISQVFQTGLISNFTNSAFLQRSLRKFGIISFLDYIIISDTIGWRKPHPKIFETFLDSLNVKADETVYVGDDLEADIKGAKDSGILAVFINRKKVKMEELEGDYKPDIIVNSLMELEKILEI
jgi:putative hydrolase of the HAD superfamily